MVEIYTNISLRDYAEKVGMENDDKEIQQDICFILGIDFYEKGTYIVAIDGEERKDYDIARKGLCVVLREENEDYYEDGVRVGRVVSSRSALEIHVLRAGKEAVFSGLAAKLKERWHKGAKNNATTT